MIYTMQKIKNFFIKPRLSQEAFYAYYNRLPDTVQVSWKRDGGMIVGNVKAGGKEFFTQGRDVDDFVDMVNDSLYTVYEIPFDYIDAIRSVKAFQPTQEEMNALYNINTKKANVFLRKEKNVQIA